MQDDQTTKAVDDLIKKVEDSGADATNPTLADNPLNAAAEAPVAESSKQETPADPSGGVASEEQTAPLEATPASSTTSSDNNLDPIKKEALQKLEPLVNELDLSPEEKYRALMMIIQANDNKDLINEAYQAAEKIEDNKTRAQALLGIINEIDYFKNKENVSG